MHPVTVYAVDGGKTMKFVTEPLLGGDKRSPIVHSNIDNPILPTVYQGKTVPLETIDEVINLQSGPPLTYQVKVVPHHGPILPTIVAHKVQPLDPAGRMDPDAIDRVVRKWAAKIGLMRGYSAHSMRATFITYGA